MLLSFYISQFLEVVLFVFWGKNLDSFFKMKKKTQTGSTTGTFYRQTSLLVKNLKSFFFCTARRLFVEIKKKTIAGKKSIVCVWLMVVSSCQLVMVCRVILLISGCWLAAAGF